MAPLNCAKRKLKDLQLLYQNLLMVQVNWKFDYLFNENVFSDVKWLLGFDLTVLFLPFSDQAGPSLKPGTAGWEPRMVPLCYVIPPNFKVLFTYHSY